MKNWNDSVGTWLSRILFPWFFISVLYLFLFDSLPNFVKLWILDNLGGNTIIIFSPEQVGVLVSFILFGLLAFFLGKWTFNSWRDVIGKKKHKLNLYL